MKKGSEMHPYFGFLSPSLDFSLGLLYNKNSYPLPRLIPQEKTLPQVFLFYSFFSFLSCFPCQLFLYGILKPPKLSLASLGRVLLQNSFPL